jgi:hypothetical protein
MQQTLLELEDIINSVDESPASLKVARKRLKALNAELARVKGLLLTAKNPRRGTKALRELRDYFGSREDVLRRLGEFFGQ